MHRDLGRKYLVGDARASIVGCRTSSAAHPVQVQVIFVLKHQIAYTLSEVPSAVSFGAQHDDVYMWTRPWTHLPDQALHVQPSRSFPWGPSQSVVSFSGVITVRAELFQQARVWGWYAQ